MLNGKNVLLGISAGIAAYKAAFLCRLLIKKGANVKVLMTPSSADFITPLTLSTLSKNPVVIEYFDPKNGDWNNHVDLAKWSDFFLLAPATANTLAKMAQGICDNALLATYFSMENPVFFAPAMDLDMYQNESIKANIQTLIEQNKYFIPAESGELASGLSGEGRMAEPENIISFLEHHFQQNLKGKKILITAGPTHEAIDPVRFIGNHSSGKMGYAIAQQAKLRGAEVCLISGPTSVKPIYGVELVNVTSAAEMFEAVKANYLTADYCIMSAAVADYTPINKAKQKIKKSGDSLSIQLKRTTDILKWLGDHKLNHQKLIGFALETENELENAKKKIHAKSLDFIVLNSLNDKGAGFGHDTNRVRIIDRDNKVKEIELKHKLEIAKDILNEIEHRWIS